MYIYSYPYLWGIYMYDKIIHEKKEAEKNQVIF